MLLDLTSAPDNSSFVSAHHHLTCAQPVLGSHRNQYLDRRCSQHMSYQSSIGRLLESLWTEFHAYADDTQIYTALMTDTVRGLEKLSKCTIDLQHWFLKNDLLNPDKTDVALCGTRPGLKRSGLPSSISVAGCAIIASERLKILGVTLDVTLSFDDHIISVVRACNYHMRALRHIRCTLQILTRHRKYHSVQHRWEQVILLKRAIVRSARENSKSSTACSEQFGTNSLWHRHQQTSWLWPWNKRSITWTALPTGAVQIRYQNVECMEMVTIAYSVWKGYNNVQCMKMITRTYSVVN